MTKGFFYLIAALLYMLFPRDLIPDFLVGWGWLDDLLVVYVLWRIYRRQRQVRKNTNPTGDARQSADGRQSRTTGDGGRARPDPYAVLEIDPGASTEEIKAAYRRLVAEYHPDKVQHLGKDLQELAETRFKEIQRAYDILVRR